MDFEEYPFKETVFILYGDAGVGKTFSLLMHPLREQGIYFDLEIRYQEILRAHPEIRMNAYYMGMEPPTHLPDNITLKKGIALNTYVVVAALDEELNFDYVKTFDNLKRAIRSAKNLKPKFIAIDGIEDLRSAAKLKYEKEHHKAAYGPQAWGEINNTVKGLIYPLINYARLSGIYVGMTSHLGWKYSEDGNPIGKTITTKEYILNFVDGIYILRKGKDGFTYECVKSPYGPSERTKMPF